MKTIEALKHDHVARYTSSTKSLVQHYRISDTRQVFNHDNPGAPLNKTTFSSLRVGFSSWSTIRTAYISAEFVDFMSVFSDNANTCTSSTVFPGKLARFRRV